MRRTSATTPRPGDIRAILEKTKDRPECSVITALALRSMQKARYDVAPLGHYGLAMADYCHFTSPIRRYPDLVVSRALTAKLTGQPIPMMGEELADAAVRSSERERAAIDAERAADKLMMARLMAHHVGEDYDGTINGVSEYGMYITLSNGAEGFVPCAHWKIGSALTSAACCFAANAPARCFRLVSLCV